MLRKNILIIYETITVDWQLAEKVTMYKNRLKSKLTVETSSLFKNSTTLHNLQRTVLTINSRPK